MLHTGRNRFFLQCGPNPSTRGSQLAQLTLQISTDKVHCAVFVTSQVPSVLHIFVISTSMSWLLQLHRSVTMFGASVLGHSTIPTPATSSRRTLQKTTVCVLKCRQVSDECCKCILHAYVEQGLQVHVPCS